ncbi:MAG: winged helix-turn-helix transcriptional regulator, partial [Halobacteriales archaeon]|nr:winged helix-turn-helix transcriptional regulator [Halobacteriales archaeon]
PLVLDDATVLVVSHGPTPHASPHRFGPAVLRFAPNGTFLQETELETVPDVSMPSDQAWAFTGPHGSAAAVWKVGAFNASLLRSSISHDGGRTWDTPRNLTGIPGGNGALDLTGSLDALGTLHLLAVSWQGPSASEMRHILVPRLGEPRVEPLPWTGDPLRLATDASIASAGGRTWALANVATAPDIIEDNGGSSAKMRTVAWEWLPELVGFRPAHEFEVQQSAFSFDEGRPSLLPDGRLVVTGYSSEGYAAVPLFDPFPEPACASHRPLTGHPPVHMGPPLASQTCGERFSFDVIPGGVLLAQSAAGPVATSPSHPLFPVASLPLSSVAAAGGAVVGGIALLALAATDAARYGIGLLLASLFSRVQGRQVLQHAIRGGIYDHILANPGIRFNHLRKDLGLSHGATAHHLQVLERNGLVRQRTAWTTRHYYTAGAPPPAALEAHDAILDFVRKNPGAGAAEVGRHLGLSRQLAHYHLRRLAAAGRTAARRP